ncbi:MAG: YicC/YloC family endoribonuclease [Candidatus Omnitrophota bacterium]
MIRSMTGFGRGAAKGKYGTFKAEIRSVNHKFLELSVKMPETLSLFEDKAREVTAGSIKRGKAYLSVFHDDGVSSADKIVVDEKIARSYYQQLMGLKKKINAEGSIRLDQIIMLPGVIKYEHKEIAPAKLWPFVAEALAKALRDLNGFRDKEGRAILTDLKTRVKIMRAATAVIQERSKINVKAYRARLKTSIGELSKTETAGFDKGRLEQEVALYAKNSDIAEEITRISAHLDNLLDTLADDPEPGKKIDFIAQELNREINTVGSKASDFKIAQKVIQVKSEIDKLREQAKNIE